MPTYRILVFDYGHINASDTVEAATRGDAIKAAQELQIAKFGSSNCSTPCRAADRGPRRALQTPT